MTERDRRHWDDRYAQRGPAHVDEIVPPSFLAPHADLVPSTGCALDVACGRGIAAAWLAGRGLRVRGLDVSGVAIEQARALARRSGVGDRCRFDVVDLDAGLPPGASVDMLLCNNFRDRHLDRALIERLAPGGLLAISALSEVDAAPGTFRATPGELPTAFAELDLIAAGERGGQAWLVARAPGKCTV